jgi:uncharacterized protein YggE
MSSSCCDRNKAGAVIDAAASAVGDIRMGRSRSASRPTSALADARRGAVEEGVPQAQRLAAAAGDGAQAIRPDLEGNRWWATAIRPMMPRMMAAEASVPCRARQPEAFGVGRDRVGDRPAPLTR